jgi:hypothetical protein
MDRNDSSSRVFSKPKRSSARLEANLRATTIMRLAGWLLSENFSSSSIILRNVGLKNFFGISFRDYDAKNLEAKAFRVFSPTKNSIDSKPKLGNLITFFSMFANVLSGLLLAKLLLLLWPLNLFLFGKVSRLHCRFPRLSRLLSFQHDFLPSAASETPTQVTSSLDSPQAKVIRVHIMHSAAVPAALMRIYLRK